MTLSQQLLGMLRAVSISDVINFRSGQVITPRWLSSEVVVSPACTLTTTSMLGSRSCVGVDTQSLLVASTSLIIAVLCFLVSA